MAEPPRNTNDTNDTKDAAAIIALVEREMPKLKRFFRSKLPEPECYDVAQETFRAFLAADRDAMKEPAAYLWGIAHKQLCKYFERRRDLVAFDSTRMSVAELGTTLSVRVDRRNRLVEALRSIPLDEQVAFELRYGEECSLEEVAEATGVSLATVKRRISAAREKLAIKLLPKATESTTQEIELDEREAQNLAEAYRNA